MQELMQEQGTVPGTNAGTLVQEQIKELMVALFQNCIRLMGD